MKVYILFTSYPYEGGYVHGVFSSYDKAKRAWGSEEFDFGHDDTEIRELVLDNWEFQEIEI